MSYEKVKKMVTQGFITQSIRLLSESSHDTGELGGAACGTCGMGGRL